MKRTYTRRVSRFVLPKRYYLSCFNKCKWINRYTFYVKALHSVIPCPANPQSMPRPAGRISVSHWSSQWTRFTSFTVYLKERNPQNNALLCLAVSQSWSRYTGCQSRFVSASSFLFWFNSVNDDTCKRACKEQNHSATKDYIRAEGDFHKEMYSWNDQ